MATVTKKRRGVYLGQVYLGRDKSGKKIIENRTFHGTERECRSQIDKWEASLKAKPRTTGLTFLDVMDEVMEGRTVGWSDSHLSGFELSRRRLAEYDTTKNPADYDLGHKPVGSITRSDIIGFFKVLARSMKHAKGQRKGQQKAYAIDQHRRHLSAAFTYAAESEIIAFSPMPSERQFKALVSLTPTTRVEHRQLPDVDEVLTSTGRQKITDAQARMINIALGTGLRRGEIDGLQFGDFGPRYDDGSADLHLERQVVVVKTKALRKALGKSYEIKPATKNGHGRTLRVPAHLMELIDEAQIAQNVERLEAGEDPVGKRDWLFTANWVDPLCPDVMTRWWEKIRKRAGLPTLRLHDLRHIHISHLVAAGVDIRTVADRAGHDPSVTMGTYSHKRPGTDEAAAMIIGKAMSGES